MKVLLLDQDVADIVRGERVAGGTRICEVPSFNQYVNVGDIVETVETKGLHVAVEIVSSAGWSNFGLAINVHDTEQALKVLRLLETLGCVVGVRRGLLVNIGVPPNERDRVFALLEKSEGDGTWSANAVLDRKTTLLL